MASPEEAGEERRKLALAAASETSKHVLTLTTVVVTITISFAKDIAGDSAASDLLWLKLAWLAHAISVLAGVGTLLALAGTANEPDSTRSIYSTNIRLPAAMQMAFFGLGLALVVIFGVLAT
ncbi:hypothetical protein BGM19_26700 [Streptomyces agglomeratus]|uniref:hypothetical protein n=1 Tax=Streptomyces agglomeratus TaxID=285458 RepID=UPI000868BA91|nr:hypothetical protein [Streptomyces agglomeratus]OEJ61066.1 hypothetical protein BGM19_26700 [Streptomyces agglomeratus]